MTRFNATGIAGAEIHHDGLSDVDLSAQAVAHVLPVGEVTARVFKRIEFIHELPETLQVAQQECNVRLIQGHEFPWSVPARSAFVIGNSSRRDKKSTIV
jgi:hypothetical protein